MWGAEPGGGARGALPGCPELVIISLILWTAAVTCIGVCVCVCACVRHRWREENVFWGVCMCVCVCDWRRVCVWGCMEQWKE